MAHPDALLAGALKTLGANKDLALPIKLFELSDVVFLAPKKEVGSTNQRQLVAVHCSKESGFEVIHGLLNRVMEVLGIPLRQGESSPEMAKQVGLPRCSDLTTLCVRSCDSARKLQDLTLQTSLQAWLKDKSTDSTRPREV